MDHAQDGTPRRRAASAPGPDRTQAHAPGPRPGTPGEAGPDTPDGTPSSPAGTASSPATGDARAADASSPATSDAGDAQATDATGSQPGYAGGKAAYLARLRRIEGQARGIHRMIDEEQYCIDILTQISALTSALENVALGLLEDHLRHCVAHAAETGGEVADEKLTEAAAAIRRLVKS